MNPKSLPFALSRRQLLTGLTTTAAAAFWWEPGALAEALTQTAPQTEGPFYPDKLPLDTDNDLILINEADKSSAGEITWLSGRILDKDGKAVPNALVEIWQADANGAYIHSKSDNGSKRDGNFQGFGRFRTGLKGEYLFRTIKPVPYPGRTPHIHIKVKVKGKPEFTTQCYIKDHAQNEKDGLIRRVADAKARASLMAEFLPLVGSKTGELAATFDVVLGFTPEQP